MQRSTRVHINQLCAEQRVRQGLNIPVRDLALSSSERQREFILFICFYCMTRLESRALHSHSAF